MNKHLFIKLPLLLAILFIGTLTTQAQTTLTSDSGLKVTIPAGWKYEVSPEKVLSVSSPDDLAHFTLHDIPANNIDAALAAAEQEIKGMVTDFKEKEPQKNMLNGMEAIFAEGSGKIEGVSMDLGILLVKNGSHVLFMFGAVATMAGNKHDNAITEMIKSIKK